MATVTMPVLVNHDEQPAHVPDIMPDEGPSLADDQPEDRNFNMNILAPANPKTWGPSSVIANGVNQCVSAKMRINFIITDACLELRETSIASTVSMKCPTLTLIITSMSKFSKSPFGPSRNRVESFYDRSGTIYFKNPDCSQYFYNPRTGFSRYTFPPDTQCRNAPKLEILNPNADFEQGELMTILDLIE